VIVAPVFALDFDGTLVSCRERHVAVAAAVIGELGLPPLDAQGFWASKRRGASTREALRLAGYGDHDAARVAELWGERVELSEWLRLDTPWPGACEAVARVRTARLCPVVLTARRDAAAVRAQVAAAVDVGPAAVFVVSPYSAAEQKARRLREMGATGFVGDTESDAAAARSADVPFAAVSNGQRSESFLHDLGLAVYTDVFRAVESLVG
jgi:phosphoglycolate phosphatase-like HAD superfamily hydrolase